ncbi:MAG: SLBB domain-containing protein [Ignavibacteria bacterium]|nr:SLBB domain-containing protein [Ignavibacteria bacterium]
MYFYSLVLSLVLIPTILFAQSSVSYPERAGLLSKDSTALASVSLAADGGIDTLTFRVGTGDRFLISIVGLEEVVFNSEIDREGSIYLPRLGNIYLKNDPLYLAKEKISTSLRKIYKNVEIHISLIEIRKIKISVAGDIKNTAELVIYANSRLSDVISRYIWLNPSSNLRKIKIVSEDEEIKKYDYLKYLRNADKENNPYLKDRDFIYIDKIDRTISVIGAVKFQGIYEFVENEYLFDLINVTGGFLSKARLDTIEVVRFEDDFITQTTMYLSYQELIQNNFLIKNGDRIIVRDIPRYMIDNSVLIEGFVKYPGVYKITDDETTLFGVIQEAGGFLPNASLQDAFVKREIGLSDDDPEFERLKIIPRADMTDDEYDYFKSKSRLRKGKVVADFSALFEKNDKSENIKLRRNDVITVPEKKDFVTLIGQVVNPGNVPYRPNFKINDYIKIGGGFAWRALKSDIRVIKANTGEWVDADDVTEIEPGDGIWIPEDPPGPKFWVLFKDVLVVVGQVATVVAATMAVVASTR